MRILWFTGNGAIYSNTNKYNGGGWVGALANELVKYCPNIELGMAIPWKYKFKDEKEGVNTLFFIFKFILPWYSHSKFYIGAIFYEFIC